LLGVVDDDHRPAEGGQNDEFPLQNDTEPARNLPKALSAERPLIHQHDGMAGGQLMFVDGSGSDVDLDRSGRAELQPR
jgi:hypothetical protein